MKSALIFLGIVLCLGVPALAADKAPTAAADAVDARLNALASKPYRPEWAPLPVFQGSADLIPLLHEILGGASADSRAKAAFLLGQIGSSASAGPLAKGLKNPDRMVRMQCGTALACIGDGRGVPTCAAVLSSGPDWMRYYAAYGLWRVGGTRAKDVLSKNQGNRNPLVAAAVDGALNSPRVLPPDIRPAPKKKGAPELTVDDILDRVSDAYVRESDWWFHEGDYEQCIRCLRALVFMDPGDVDSYSLISWMQWNLGRNSEAEQTLRELVAQNPDDADAFFEQGEYYMRLKDYAHAEEPLRKSVELGGGQLHRRQYAHCLESLGKLTKALEQWAILQKASPNDPAVRYNYDRVKKLVDAGRK